MTFPFETSNPGIGFLDNLTQSEIDLIQQLAGLVDPNADRILFWDDSANSYAYLTVGSGLTLNGTTLTASGGAGLGDVVGPASAVDSNIAAFDTTTGKLIKDGGIALSAIVTGTPWTSVGYYIGDGSAFATAAQGGKADTAVQPAGLSTYQLKPIEGAFVDGDKTKLNGIATGATANSSDATLLARANHTGTQLASTISDFSSAALSAAPAETATTLGAAIGGAADATPNDTDYVATALTAAGALKKITWTNVKAFLKTYFDTLYLALSGGTMTGKVTGAGKDEVGKAYTPASGSQTVALDCSVNNVHLVTGNSSGTAITFTVTGATNNQVFMVSILQGTTPSTIAGWFATVRWAGGTAPTLTPTNAKRDTFIFIRTGTNTYDGFVVGQAC